MGTHRFITRSATVLSGALAASVLGGIGIAAAASPSPSPQPTSGSTVTSTDGTDGAAGTSTAATTSCNPLPGYVAGQPAWLHVLGAKGAYVWHDADGWHVRVTHPSHSTVVFSGTVQASAPITFTRVVDERQDVVTTSPDHKTLAFRLVNHGMLDGFDFRDQCAPRMSVLLRVDGAAAPRGDFFIGAHDSRAVTNPWVVVRRPEGR